MYEPLPNFYTSVIQARVRNLVWHGTVTDSDETGRAFTAESIVANTGTVTREVASSTDIELGTVYAAELKIGLYIDDIGVSRTKLYGGKISLGCTASTVSGNNFISGEIPVGVFNITEATQKGRICTITAYDDMIKFDKDYLGVSGLATPYNWASNFCQKCGVELGMTESDFEVFPNGTVSLTLIWNDDIKTYRDALSHLAAAIGAVAIINRVGKLIFIPLASSSPVATVTAGDRFGSDIAHTTFRPKTIYLTNEETGELVTATSGTGNAYFDIGSNALLQADGRIRDLSGATVSTVTVQTMLNNIIAPVATFSSVPIEAEIPCDPCLDLLDCVTLTGGQASAGGTTVKLTTIETKLGGSTKVKCAGSNTAEASTEEQRAARNSGGTKDILMWQSSDSNPAEIIINIDPTNWGDLIGISWDSLSHSTWASLIAGGFETELNEVTLTVSKDWAKGLLNFTVNYTLDVDAKVKYRVLLDDETVWELDEEHTAGMVIETITTPIDIWSNSETDPHSIRVTMTGEILT